MGCRKESLPTVKTMGGEAGVYLHPDGLSHYALLRINEKEGAEMKAKYIKTKYIISNVPKSGKDLNCVCKKNVKYGIKNNIAFKYFCS